MNPYLNSKKWTSVFVLISTLQLGTLSIVQAAPTAADCASYTKPAVTVVEPPVVIDLLSGVRSLLKANPKLELPIAEADDVTATTANEKMIEKLRNDVNKFVISQPVNSPNDGSENVQYLYSSKKLGDGGISIYKNNLFIEGFFRRMVVEKKLNTEDDTMTFADAIHKQTWMEWNGFMYQLRTGSPIKALIKPDPVTGRVTLYRGMTSAETSDWMKASKNKEELKQFASQLASNTKAREIFFSPQLEGASIWATDGNVIALTLSVKSSKALLENSSVNSNVYAGIEYSYIEVAMPAVTLASLLEGASITSAKVIAPVPAANGNGISEE